jgi:uncharacterized membrane protein/mono/diheme cytochrome c family protein
MLVLAQSSTPQAGQENPLARAALDAFASKCVQCHGPDVAHPKAAFGYVTDLGRLVASEKYVVPRNLEKSMLWKEVEEGDMPPDEARAGPLTSAETEAIRQWIVGGAPPLTSLVSTAREAAAPEVMLPSPAKPASAPMPESWQAPEPPSSRAVKLLGRFHVLVVHFPIALLLIAALTEVWGTLRRSTAVSPAGRLCLLIGAISAIVAAALGWIHALDGFAGPLASPTSIMGLHRWIGAAVGAVAPVVAMFSEHDVRRGTRSRGVRACILVLGLAAGGAGHFGGLLTHGAEYFTS